MHALFAHPALVRGILLFAGGLLRWRDRKADSVASEVDDRTLVSWSSRTHSRRADEAARECPR